MISFKQFCQKLDESVDIKIDESEQIPLKTLHNHVQEYLGNHTSTKLANAMRTGTDTHTTWDKINSGLKDIGVKPRHIAVLAMKLKPAQYSKQ